MIEEVLSVKCQVLSRARRSACSHGLLTSNSRRNADWPEAIPQCVTGDGVSARKTQNTVLAHVVFWCSGILVFWAGGPKNAVLGTPAPCVFGTWHVARGTWRSGFSGQKRGGQPALGQEKLMAGSSSLPTSYFTLHTATESPGQSRQTNPISATMSGGAKALRARSYGEYNIQ